MQLQEREKRKMKSILHNTRNVQKLMSRMVAEIDGLTEPEAKLFLIWWFRQQVKFSIFEVLIYNFSNELKIVFDY